MLSAWISSSPLPSRLAHYGTMTPYLGCLSWKTSLNCFLKSCFILWGIIPKDDLLNLLHCSFCSSFCHRKLILVFFDIVPLLWGFFFFYSPPFWYDKIPQTPLLYFFSEPCNQQFLLEASFLSLEKVLGTKICAYFHIIVSFRFGEYHFS